MKIEGIRVSEIKHKSFNTTVLLYSDKRYNKSDRQIKAWYALNERTGSEELHRNEELGTVKQKEGSMRRHLQYENERQLLSPTLLFEYFKYLMLGRTCKTVRYFLRDILHVYIPVKFQRP